MQEKAGEEIGDVAENFLDLTKDQEDKLDKDLAVFIEKWLRENGLFPDFYKVENAEEIEIKYPKETTPSPTN